MVTPQSGSLEGVVNVRFGSLADICSAKGHVRFTPEIGHQRVGRNYLLKCQLWTRTATEFRLAVVSAKRVVRTYRHSKPVCVRPACSLSRGKERLPQNNEASLFSQPNRNACRLLIIVQFQGER